MYVNVSVYIHTHKHGNRDTYYIEENSPEKNPVGTC